MNADLDAGEIENLYTAIRQDPHVLENFDRIPFVNTPLHVAASAGQVKFATEIIRLMPSFAVKLNEQGLSPMHLALENRHYTVVRRFVSINKELVRVKGKKGHTPLHLAAENGQIHILMLFLEACPDSIEDLAVEGETALHIAVRERQFEELQVLVVWLQRTSSCDRLKSILNWTHESGDAILQVLERMNLPESETIRRMLLCAGSSATDAPDLAATLMSKITFLDVMVRMKHLAEVDDTTRNTLVAAAGVIATITYESALSPPGGVHPAADPAANNTSSALLQGKSVMSSNNFTCFWILNTVGLWVSIMVSPNDHVSKFNYVYLVLALAIFFSGVYALRILVTRSLERRVRLGYRKTAAMNW